LRTTTFDGDSISVREALHLGTPVIATDNGMRPEGVRLIPISNPEALALAIEACLAGGRTRRGQARQENLEAVLALYKELMR
ncbi:MAG: glycosyl transferase family 1, partial [Bryobacteraceae bacterium]